MLRRRATGRTKQSAMVGFDRGQQGAVSTQSRSRPTDEQIIEVLALHYRVHESTVIEWLLQMDLSAQSEKLASNF